MSEHEGFCVPLLESMFFETPIIAYGSTAIPYTLGDSGILVREKRYEEIAEMMDLLIENKELKNKIIKRQTERLNEFSKNKIKNMLKTYLDQANEYKPNRLDVRVEGTFEDSYSLSIVNRNLALALDKLGHNVSLYATTGSGDYTPTAQCIEDERVKALWLNIMPNPEYVIRNIYPPRVKDLKGRFKLINFYWEESLIPQKWVAEFNTLDGIIVPTCFVKNVLEDSGVNSRIEVIPPGINIEQFNGDIKPIVLDTGGKFLFLNIGSGFPRKGIDILIKAFTEEFSREDDVCLILKTFPNIHNKVADQIENIKRNDRPQIIHIDRDLSNKDVVALYRRCNCFVSPTRGEGFGLPIAEAMLCKIPVIATNYGGHLDFCNDNNSYLINYKLVPSKSHLQSEYEIVGSMWAEPEVQHLRYLMRAIYRNRDSAEVKDKIDAAHDCIKNNFTWDVSAKSVVEFLKRIDQKIRLGMVTTWNTKCGIAEYTRNLAEKLGNELDIVIFANEIRSVELVREDEPNVIRCWRSIDARDGYFDRLNMLYQNILENNLNIVHFQFNFSLFELNSFSILLKKLRTNGIKTIITFHSVDSAEDIIFQRKKISLRNIKDELVLVDKIWVHTPNDIKKLIQFGINQNNVILIPQGNKLFPEVAKTLSDEKIFANSKIISTFGFFLPHKGILETIEAMPKLLNRYPDTLLIVICSLYPVTASLDCFEKCKSMVNQLCLNKNVLFFTDFLKEDEIVELLRLSNIVVMPYKETKESSSAAVRFALSSFRPVITTDVPIFNEFDNEVFKIIECNPENIAQGVIELFENREFQLIIVNNARKWVEKRSWTNISKEYIGIILDITKNPGTEPWNS